MVSGGRSGRGRVDYRHFSPIQMNTEGGLVKTVPRDCLFGETSVNRNGDGKYPIRGVLPDRKKLKLSNLVAVGAVYDRALHSQQIARS